jgi:hypothetical protein
LACLFCTIGSRTGLPDGLFSYQKSQFRFIFEGAEMENLGIFFGHFWYFKAIWVFLMPFGVFCDYLVHIFGMLHRLKSGNPAPETHCRN